MMLTSNRRKKALTTTILLALTIALIPVLMPNLKVNGAGTTLEIIPTNNVYYANQTMPGTAFILNATVVNITDLQNWQIRLEWNASILDFVNITLPADNVFALSGKSLITPPVDHGPGYVMWGVTYINGAPGTPEYWTFNGTGTLCQIALKILPPTGLPPFASNLTLTNVPNDTFLLNGAGIDITFTTVDGTFVYNDFLTLTISPSSVQVNYGEGHLFTAIAINGSLPYAYNWYFKWPNGTEIEVTTAANSTTWTSFPVTEVGDHKVTVKVTDNIGLTLNATANLRLRSLSLTIDPQSVSANVGGSVTFNLTITGGIPPYETRWFRNETEISALENTTTVTINFPTTGLDNIKVNVTDSTDTTKQVTVPVIIYTTPTTFINVIPTVGTGTFYSNMTMIGDTLMFNVTVADATDLQLWQVKLTWNATLLDYSSATIPDDNVFAGTGRSLIIAGPNVEPGSLSYGATYINDPYWTFNGTGTLFQVEFEIIHQPAAPSSSSQIAPVDLYYPLGTFIQRGDGNNIPFTTTNGTYTYVLVSPVAHQLFGITFWTYTNTSIIANDTAYNQPDAWIDILTITGAPGTAAYINFTLPKTLIKLLNPTDVWIVKLDGVDVTSQATITQNADYTNIYLEFTFVDTNVVVRADGTWMVPETMQLLIIALLMSSLIVVILAKAAQRKKWIKY